ncbi:hypothetical protein [Chondrinema litorale]|uniref:hypothetical protein n=1 Tax=Chondrinema litorale TaxID=2994555 RepID=UPI002543804A|nr:hypothetical protein [Chondrinema litorale]UZS00011.1 hypothetical protein OQ292_39200 [Chondrinema litorale]
MRWSLFISSIIIIYIVWYLLNFLKDLLFTTSKERVRDDTVHYDIDLLDEDETQTVDVHNESDIFLPSSESQDVQPEEKEASKPDVKNTEITLNDPPESEGIPIADFLKRAKANAESASNNIQYT